MTKWETSLKRAKSHYCKMNYHLQEAVKSLMLEKGFSEEVASEFRCDFASGVETVISFKQDGEMSDLDLLVASNMTKDEIIKRLSRNMYYYNIQTLKDIK